MEILHKTELSQFTTFRVGGIAEKVCLPSSINELLEALDNSMSKNEAWSIVGGGSNLLVSSDKIPGNVICTTGINSIELIGPDLIEAGAGARLPRLSANAAKLNLSGMEFFEGIPGTVGGAVVMNAGAHGSWTNQILVSVNILDLADGKIKTLTPKDINFGYRQSSINPTKQIVLSARFRLASDTEAAIRSRMKEFNFARVNSQPIKQPSAGCTFRNPLEVNKSAGKIIDELGLKNLSIGSAQISSVHANFIVNNGNASSHEICELITKVQDTVHEKYNILLKPEVKPLGIFKKSEAIIWTNSDQTENNSFIITK